jgi:hypothetical protein
MGVNDLESQKALLEPEVNNIETRSLPVRKITSIEICSALWRIEFAAMNFIKIHSRRRSQLS